MENRCINANDKLIICVQGKQFDFEQINIDKITKEKQK